MNYKEFAEGQQKIYKARENRAYNKAIKDSTSILRFMQKNKLTLEQAIEIINRLKKN